MAGVDHDIRAIDALRDDAEHWRGLYLACFSAACEALHEAQRTIAVQRAQIAEMREERARMARGVFGWTAAQEPEL